MKLDICLEKRMETIFARLRGSSLVELARDPTWWPWPLELAIEGWEFSGMSTDQDLGSGFANFLANACSYYYYYSY
jgi:hypothetical protein